MESNAPSVQALYEELDALLLRIALTEMDEEELSALSGKQEESGYSQEAKKRTLALIDKRFRRREYRNFFHRTLPRFGVVAAALLLVFFLGLSAAVAMVPSVRVSLMNFIINIEKEYTELSLSRSDDAYMDVPGDWKGSYFPAYIPDGFTFRVLDMGIKGIYHSVYYTDANENKLSFSEYNANSYVNIDTEDGDNSMINIAGADALVSEKEGHVFVAWVVDNRYFIVSLDGSREMAIEIAESVRMIK